LNAYYGGKEKQMKNNTTTMIEPCYGDREYTTIQELTEGAISGDLLAAYYLAQHYEEGTIVERDYNKAAELYMVVSKCREPLVFADPDMPLTPQCEAEYAVGCMYEKDLLPDSSMEKAMEWFLKSVQDGGSDACYKMAELHLEGRYVAQDYDKAVHYLYNGYYEFGRNADAFMLASKLEEKTSTGQGVVWEILADCYTYGIGVEKDDTKAAIYCAKCDRLTHEVDAKDLEWSEMTKGITAYNEFPF
jgi:TPR repeat protein